MLEFFGGTQVPTTIVVWITFEFSPKWMTKSSFWSKMFKTAGEKTFHFGFPSKSAAYSKRLFPVYQQNHIIIKHSINTLLSVSNVITGAPHIIGKRSSTASFRRIIHWKNPFGTLVFVLKMEYTWMVKWLLEWLWLLFKQCKESARKMCLV